MNPSGSAYRLIVTRTGAVLADHTQVARSWFSRLVGLLGRSHLPPGEALVIPACRSIHTWFMRFSIDAVFVDDAWRVVAMRQTLSPWRVTSVIWNARSVIELPSGTIQRLGLRLGDALALKPPGEIPAQKRRRGSSGKKALDRKGVDWLNL